MLFGTCVYLPLSGHFGVCLAGDLVSWTNLLESFGWSWRSLDGVMGITLFEGHLLQFSDPLPHRWVL